MEELILKSNEMQECIFLFDKLGFSKKLGEFINMIVKIQLIDNVQRMLKLNAILTEINIAMETRDYLLVADILKYKFEPILTD